MPTTVINIRSAPPGWQTNPQYVYIGRAGRGMSGYFGNPFSIEECGGRDECIAAFSTWFDRTIKTEPGFRAQVLELKGKTLVCFCKPQRCHGDIYAWFCDK